MEITNLRVEVLVAYHDTRRHRPRPEPVIRAVQELELNPNEILFIGDRTTDIIAGKRAGAFTGAAMWGLNEEERAREIRGAFTIREDARDAIHGRTILILDDVLTTGATTNECAKVLKENGARRVYVLAISRHM